MPTEELFGAYHFLLEVAGDPPRDSFDFTAEAEPREAALILPAVQMAREAARTDDAALEPLDALLIINDISSSADDGHDGWTDVLAIDWGAERLATDETRQTDLRSDGDLVQAVSEVDLGGDFIL